VKRAVVRSVMRQTLADKAVQSQPNSLRSSLDDLRAGDANMRVEPCRAPRVEVLDLIRRAMATRDLSQKAFALTAGCLESELSDALRGKDHRRFDAAWLWAQDDDFLLTFIELAQAARQLTPEHKRALRQRRIVELVGLLLSEVA
jgi:hypothetical protein